MFSVAIFDNLIALIFWSLVFANAVVFWTSRAILQHKLTPAAVLTLWHKDTLRLACFLALIMTDSAEKALLDVPRSRVLTSAFVGGFFAFLLAGLSFNSVRSGFAQADWALVVNYGLWLVALVAGLFQAWRVVQAWQRLAIAAD